MALDVRAADGEWMPPLTGAAAKFQPHITLRGRFEAPLGRTQREIVSRLHPLFERFQPRLINLLGPMAPNDHVLWYECLPGAEAYECLQQLHQGVESILRSAVLIGIDHVLEEHGGAGYRPHLTISWRTRPIRARPPKAALTVSPVAAALYSYEIDPLKSHVERFEIISYAS